MKRSSIHLTVTFRDIFAQILINNRIQNAKFELEYMSVWIWIKNLYKIADRWNVMEGK